MSTETRKYALKARAEKQAETRRRIVEATAALHTEVGPAQTTVAEIARRAGVQRLTVYNNFPDERQLFEACGAHLMRIRLDRQFDDLSTALAAGFTDATRSTKGLRPAVALAIDFWTWRRLAGEWMSDAEAAALMVGAVQAAVRG